MTKKIVAVFDKSAEAYGRPFIAENVGLAERDFATACKDTKTPMFMYPYDIELHLLGEFDEVTGEIKQEAIIKICEAKNYFTEEELKTKIKTKNFQNPEINKEFKKQIKIKREALKNG